MFKKISFTFGVAILSSLMSVWLYSNLNPDLFRKAIHNRLKEHESVVLNTSSINLPMLSSRLSGQSAFLNPISGFVEAAKIANPTVVNISAMRQKSGAATLNNPFGDLFGDKGTDWFGYDQPGGADIGLSSGSGVIVSSDGYIITNNHVIVGSSQIKITLYDKRSFLAAVVGTDPATDLALLRINSNNLPFIRYGNSDELEVGEWVLAVGNPFNLASTVTAGIVSAKGRNINILKEEAAIESFIQTDAAVNQGNSGGALVNLQGNLIGINTAIATPSGSYAGYAFAVPVNIAKKVIEDLKNYGAVQRAYLGINTRDINPEIASRLKLKNMNGVFIEQVTTGGAGEEAGLKKDDIITEINGYKVNTLPEFKEKVARFRPGDIIGITYLRDGKMVYTKMVLKNALQTTQINAKPIEELEKLLGARFEELSVAEMSSLGIKNGIKVIQLHENGLLHTATSMKPGFIILKLNNEVVSTLEDMSLHIQKISKGDGIMLDGMYPNDKSKKLYAFSMK
ncbi:MAG: trypsin-like peptidase domain-containing protein [Sphingobacteriales bacterium]|nr:MAG: trypsin-like peptidase domain-containing protein [Sphingobacteriales bacterium]